MGILTQDRGACERMHAERKRGKRPGCLERHERQCRRGPECFIAESRGWFRGVSAREGAPLPQFIQRGVHRANDVAGTAAVCPRQLALTARNCAFVVKRTRSEEHTSELQSPDHLVCRLLLEKKKKTIHQTHCTTSHNNTSPYP